MSSPDIVGLENETQYIVSTSESFNSCSGCFDGIIRFSRNNHSKLGNCLRFEQYGWF